MTDARGREAHLVPDSFARPVGTTLCGQSEMAYQWSGQVAENLPTCPACADAINELGRPVHGTDMSPIERQQRGHRDGIALALCALRGDETGIAAVQAGLADEGVASVLALIKGQGALSATLLHLCSEATGATPDEIADVVRERLDLAVIRNMERKR